MTMNDVFGHICDSSSFQQVSGMRPNLAIHYQVSQPPLLMYKYTVVVKYYG